ncbi:hypothetical protein [Streptomyces sp. NPDC001389]|uniref:hypothetical protein n=1 Tax=Streptomyces sp. NPDC001389 TaxID=3364569 RepID=UPI00367F4D32
MSVGPQWTPPELRSQDELQAMIEHVTAHGYGSMSRTYVRGILAALDWLTGRTGQPPITGAALGRPVTGTDASREHDAAYEALYATADPELWRVTQEQGQEYTLAVEHTLAWATGGDLGLLVPVNWPFPQ